jgi:muconolactone D-isomerase
MEFLVQVRVVLPPEMPDSEREALLEAELVRGRELLAAGSIEAIWRVPGGLRNVAIWYAADATELHELIASLPLYRWLSADVTPLAAHPVTARNARGN